MMTMNRKHRAPALTALTLLAAAGGAAAAPLAAAPRPGWFAAGSRPQDYAMGIDRQRVRGGKPTGYIRSLVDDAPGFGTFMHKIDATPYQGKRVRLSAEIKTEGLSHRAGLWMRVDGPTQPLAIDNMDDRPITGTRDWAHYGCVLEVASAATRIAFGVMLGGRGRVYFGPVTLEVVDRSVPVTDLLPTIPPERYRAR
jgi:hypothetical protein